MSEMLDWTAVCSCVHVNSPRVADGLSLFAFAGTSQILDVLCMYSTGSFVNVNEAAHGF